MDIEGNLGLVLSGTRIGQPFLEKRGGFQAADWLPGGKCQLSRVSPVLLGAVLTSKNFPECPTLWDVPKACEVLLSTSQEVALL